MIRSMTAFARERLQVGKKFYIVEIQSVNKKGLEISVHVPKEVFFLESCSRKKVQEKTFRGQVSLKIFSEKGGNELFSEESVKAAYKNLVTIAKAIDKEKEVSLQMVLDFLLLPENISLNDDKEAEALFEKGLESVVNAWIQKKGEEGEHLIKDILKRCALIEASLDKISSRSDALPEKYKEKITKRLKEIESLDSDERILREVVLYAEKMDVSEEFTRLRAHIHQLKTLLTAPKEVSVGRQIDFLVQEMHREIHTLSVKIGDLEAISEALLVKQEIAKIGEQGQNIE